MADIPQNNAAAQADPAQLRTMLFRDFKGVYTKATRTAIPDGYFFNIENAIPIGDENLHTTPGLSAQLVDYTADPIYWSQGVNLNGTEYLVNFATTGRVFFYNIGTQTSTALPGTPLSGSGSRCAQWQNTAILFIDSTGYWSYDGVTMAKITGAGVPTAGTDIAVYAQYVWIVNGRQLFVNGLGGGVGFGATTWSAANGAQVINLIDPSLRGSVQRLIAANGYLYLIAAVGINAISDVYVPTGASPPAAQFSNQNIQALIGTDQPASVFPYDRLLMFGSQYGTHTLFGVSAPKVSGDIDGTWQYLDTTQQISGGQVVVENILCGAFLLKLLADTPNRLPARTIIALWFQTSDTSPQTGVTETTDVWWFANYGAVSFIVTGILNNIPTLFCFIANKMYQCFANPSNVPQVNIQTKLWPMEDELARKESVMAGFQAFFIAYGSQLGITVDNENVSYPLATPSVVQGNWVNGIGVQGQWVNSTPVLGGWVAFATLLLFSDARGGFGRHVGLTLTSLGYHMEVNLFALDYKLRDRWF